MSNPLFDIVGNARIDEIAKAAADEFDELEALAARVLATARALSEHDAASVASLVESQRSNALSKVADALGEGIGLMAAAGARAASTACAPWTDSRWESEDGVRDGVSNRDDDRGLIRLGRLSLEPSVAGWLPADDLPYLAQPLGQTNVVVGASPAERGASLDFLRGLLTRLLASEPAGMVDVAVIDPEGMGSGLDLRFWREAGMPRPLVAQTEIDGHMAKVLDDVANRGAQFAGRGGVRGQQGGGALDVPFSVLVVLDYPSGWDERSVVQLSRVMREGPPRGISVVLHRHHPTPDLGYGRMTGDEAAEAVDAFAATFTLRPDRAWEASRTPGVLVLPDGPPPEVAQDSMVAFLKERATAHVINASASRATNEMWQGVSAEGLSVTIGRAGPEPMDLTFDDQTTNAFIAGPVGCGKSNALRTIIEQLAWRYPPGELEMYLLDLKGTEFTLYDGLKKTAETKAKPALPHARVINATHNDADRTSSDFALAVLRKISAELDARRKQFARAGAADLKEYRRKLPDEHMPRVLLVIDEVQGLFNKEEKAIGVEAGKRLEQIARLGRAAGIHMIMTTQDLAGIDNFNRDAVLGNFRVRIGLRQLTMEQSWRTLGGNNTGGTKLAGRIGDAVICREPGNDEANEFGTILLSDRDDYARLGEQLVASAPPDLAPLRTFSDSSDDRQLSDVVLFQDLLVSRRPSQEGLIETILGEPIDPDRSSVSVSLARGAGRHVAIVGSGDTEAVGMLQAAALSYAAQVEPRKTRFIVVDTLPPDADPEAADGPAALAASLEILGHQATLMSGEQGALEALLQAEVSLDRPEDDGESVGCIVVGFGLHEAGALNDKDERNRLNRVVQEGPRRGVHLIGWWANPARLKSLLDTKSDLNFIAVLDCEPSSLSGLVSAGATAGGGGRALLHDRSRGGPPTVVLPFAPTSFEDIESLIAPRSDAGTEAPRIGSDQGGGYSR